MLRTTATHILALGTTALLIACQDPAPETGSLKVHVSVHAVARVVEDTDGFYLALDQGSPQHVAVVDSLAFLSLQVGDHRLDLTDVRPTCSVNPPSPQFVLVRPDTVVQALFLGLCQ